MTVLPDGRIGTAIVRPDGTVDRTLEIPDETLNAVCTVWSPDDSRLACEAWDDTASSRGGIYTVQASDGGDLMRVTSSGGSNDLPGDFSPDGSQLVFKRTTDEASAPLMIVELEGGDPVPLSDQPFDDPGRFSLDGTSVLTSTGGAIIVVGLDGSVIETIQEPAASLFGPVWSPDGEWIAFSLGTSGPFADVFISRIDGADRWQVTDTPDNEIRVEWGAG
jgi:Tol biopolymer transport system component